MMLLVAGIALGAAGYYLANPALSAGGFALLVAAMIAWVIANRGAQRSGGTYIDHGDTGLTAHHDASLPADHGDT